MVCIGAAEALHCGSRENWEIVFIGNKKRAFGGTQESRPSPPSVHWLNFSVQFDISCIFFYSGFNVLLGQHTLKYQNSVYDFFPPLIILWPTYVIAHVVEWKWLIEDKPLKKTTSLLRKRWRERERWDYYLDCDGFIHTCGISNLSLFRHLTSQGSLVSSSPWRSPATGSKTNFSSCRPSTTGDDYSQCSKHTVNSIGFLERIGRGSDLCCCSIFVASCTESTLILHS